MMESTIFKGEKTPLIFGHRGCPKLAPENTLSSFSQILENNVPGVELDVQICRTGELVVFHDNNLKRITGYNANVVECDLSDIRSLDCGSHFSEKFKNEKIPLFHEVLGLLGDKVYYDIEIKADYIKNRGIEKKILTMIKDFGLEKRVLISSFNPLPLIRFKKLTNKIPLSLIYSNSKNIPIFLRKGEGRFLSKNSIIKPDSRLITDKIYNRLSKNYKIMTWTVDDDVMYRKLIAMGVKGICSNRADYFVSGKFID